jgi:adenine phosphoribosyltransferase
MEDWKNLIRTVPDFPQKGVLFRDITTLIKNGGAFRGVIDCLYERYASWGMDLVVGVESRGFIFGGALAYRLGIGFAPVRKPGKLPAHTVRVGYELEYGKDALEIHQDAIKKGDRVLILDDLLATGGTALATCQLVEKLGGIVEEVAFLIELLPLKGREKLKGYKVFSMISYEES